MTSLHTIPSDDYSYTTTTNGRFRVLLTTGSQNASSSVIEVADAPLRFSYVSPIPAGQAMPAVSGKTYTFAMVSNQDYRQAEAAFEWKAVKFGPMGTSSSTWETWETSFAGQTARSFTATIRSGGKPFRQKFTVNVVSGGENW